jgi:hypothetical protein
MFVTFCLTSNLLLAKAGMVTGSGRLRKTRRRGTVGDRVRDGRGGGGRSQEKRKGD